MERRLKEELATYFDAPKPSKKQAFLRQFGVKKINLFPLAVMQIRYVSKWVWILSGLFCGITYATIHVMEQRYVSMIFALIPFWVMISVTESMRSYRYGMEELESSARFSLKSIVLARMLILGIGNLIVLMAITKILSGQMEFHIVHIFAPYFMSTSGGFYVVRKNRGNESTFFCFILAMVVSALQMLLPWQFGEIYLPIYTPLWFIVCAIGIVITIRESYRTIRMTEDLAWN